MMKKENQWQQPRHDRKQEQATMNANKEKLPKTRHLMQCPPNAYEKKGKCHYQNPGDNIKATPSRRPNFILKTSDIGNSKAFIEKATRKESTSHTKHVKVTFGILLLWLQGGTNRPFTDG